ncbi:MAG: type II secretion system F family protein [Kiritimatiellia bacterium]
MPTFFYKAKSRDGRTVEGSVDAADRRTALALISRQNLYPITVSQQAGVSKVGARKKAPGKSESGKGRTSSGKTASTETRKTSGFRLSRPYHMTAADRLNFTSELADLLEGGMTLGNALHALARRSGEETGSSQVISSLCETIVGGESFSDALSRYPKIFTPVYVNMVRAGEASGAMIDVLRRLVAYDERSRAMRSKVQAAMVYPCIVLIMGVVVAIIVMTYILPKFKTIFDSIGPNGLPPMTRALLGINDWFKAYWVLILCLLAGGIAAFRHWISMPSGRLHWDRFKLRAPLLKGIVACSVYVNFSSTLESLLRNGVPILKALSITSQTVGNAVIGSELSNARDRVTDGTTISGPLAQGGAFPPMIIDMLSIGERTGDMPSALSHITKRYEGELEKNITIFTTALEPIMIFIVAMIIGFIAVAIMQAVLSVSSGAGLS